MKKFALLIAVLALFGAACATDTTVDSSAIADELDGADATAVVEPTAEVADEPEPEAPTPAPEPTSDEVVTDEPADDTNGDDDTTSSADPTPAPPTPAPTETPESDPAPVDISPFELSASQLAAIDEISNADDWCSAAEVVGATDDFDDLDFSDPVELEAGFKTMVAMITATQPLAPPEIASDVDQTIEGFTALTAALEDANWSFLDLDLAVLESFDGPMELATYNIDLYNFTVCGLDEDPGEPPVPAAETPDDGSNPLPIDGSIREQAVAGLVEAGFTADEAGCIVGKLDLANPESMSDPAAMFTIFDECEISLDRLAELGG